MSESRSQAPSLLDTSSWLASGFSDGEKVMKRPEHPLIFKPPAAAGLAPERAAEYSRLMREVGSERIDVWEDGTVLMSVAGWGAANRGWRIALAWSQTEPQPLLPNIDGFPGTKPKGAPSHTFSRVDGSWYVYMIW